MIDSKDFDKWSASMLSDPELPMVWQNLIAHLRALQERIQYLEERANIRHDERG